MREVDHAVPAVLAGDDSRLSALLAADATLAAQRTVFGVSPLHAAVAVGREALIAQLRPDGPLPLVLAAELGVLDAVFAALTRAPDAVHERDAAGATALHGATYRGRAAIAECLIAAGAECDGHHGRRRLAHPGPRLGDPTTPGVPQPSDDEDVVLRLAQLLLEHGADPDRPRLDGMTALHSAAWRGLDRVVQELLDAGADRTVRATTGPHAGQTPADTALAQGHLVLASRLDDGGAEVANPYG